MSEIIVFLLSMTPVGELRIAIPVGLVYGLSPLVAYTISVLGNILAVFLILTLLGVVSKWLSSHIYFFNRFFNWLFSKTRTNHLFKIEKYGLYVLPFFVAIPLPITGGWTASLIAFVFDIPFKKAFPLISLGIAIAGVIVLLISQAGIAIHDYYGWQVLLGIIFSSIVVYLIYNKRKI